MEKGKVIVGMSGGVDSTAAALLLKRQGYEVIGVTLGLWKGAESGQAVKDAAWTAEKLGIRYKVLDMSKRFRGCVIKPFMESYRNGLTPNPCVVCNPLIKEQALLEMAKAEGAAYFATGHYARIDKHPETGRYAIRNSATAAKDQTYALYRLTQEQLAAMLLPLGEYTKDEVRRIAAEIDGYSAEKGESQDICFIPDGDYAGFILRESPEDGRNVEGDFVDLEGNVLGRHKGLLHYTVGQRKGLGLSLKEPAFVLGIRPRENEVVLGCGREIFAAGALAGQFNYMCRDHFQDRMLVLAKIRYNHKGVPARIYHKEDILYCEFLEEQRAVTPGQALVLYEGQYVLGGGTILCGTGEEGVPLSGTDICCQEGGF